MSTMAENTEPPKRARKPNFIAAKCTLLLTVAEGNINIIKSKFTNAIMNKNKNKFSGGLQKRSGEGWSAVPKKFTPK